MKTILEPSDWAGALKRYQGATAQLWRFHVSLKRLLIRLSVPNSDEALYIMSGACEHMVGSFSWHNASIVIDDSDVKTRITDRAAGFELVCRAGAGLALAKVDEPWDDL